MVQSKARRIEENSVSDQQKQSIDLDQILLEIHSLTDPGVFSRDSQSAMLTDLPYIFLIAHSLDSPRSLYSRQTQQTAGRKTEYSKLSNISRARAGFGFFILRSASKSKDNVI